MKNHSRTVCILLMFFASPAWSQENGEIVRARQEWFWKRRSVNGERPLKQLIQIREEVARQSQLRKAGAVSWQSVGPRAITGTGSHDFSGRSLAVGVSLTDTNTVLLGTAGGGVWKSTDGGLSWSPRSDNLGSLAISCFAQDPVNTNNWYAGTGEPSFNADAISGIGVLKSTDGGDSWFPLNLLSTALTHISGIIVHQANPQIVVVGNYFNDTNPSLNGIYRSTDGGTSWQGTGAVGTEYRPSGLIAHPSNSDTMYAVLGRTVTPNQNGIWKSTNAGASWFLLANGAGSGLPNLQTQGGKSSISISATNPSVMYGIFSNGINDSHELIGADSGCYKSTNGGLHWFNANLPDQSSGGLTFFNGQGYYDIYVAIHPGNSNIVYAGGIDLLRTTNGGTSWSNLTVGYTASRKVHPDQQAIAFNPLNPNTLYAAGDGGVMKSFDAGVTFVDLNPTLQITQFVGLAVAAQDSARVLGGSQDNGTEFTTGSVTWNLVADGDGGFTAIDPTNFNIQYSQRFHIAGESFSQIKTTNSWSSASLIVTGLDRNDRSEFYVPYALDPNNPSVMYLGTYRMWKTTNAGSSWVAVSSDITIGDPWTITSVDLSLDDSRFVVAGTFDGSVVISTNSGSTWSGIDDPFKMPSRPVSQAAFYPNNTSALVVAFQGYSTLSGDNRGHIWKTSNLGGSWTNITGNLPDVPVNCVVIDPADPSHLVVGTDAGVFVTVDGGSTWVPFNLGFPSGAVVTRLVPHAPSGLLFAATYGRGAYKIRWTDSSAVVIPPPTSFVLYQNIPNPFNPSTRIPFYIPASAEVAIDVFNVLGQKVRTVYRGVTQGQRDVLWDGLDDAGNAVSSGVYIYRLTAPGTVQSRKMLLLK